MTRYIYTCVTVFVLISFRFVRILKSLRNGKCSDEDAAVLKATRENDGFNGGSEDSIMASKLCTHTDDVNHINKTELANLPGAPKVFGAVDSDPGLASYVDAHTPVETRIGLKVGAQVMLLKNLRVAKGLVNGARGCVTGFDKKSGMPVVRLTDVE
jgi:ATP-dependent DNA helicase PIF1